MIYQDKNYFTTPKSYRRSCIFVIKYSLLLCLPKAGSSPCHGNSADVFTFLVIIRLLILEQLIQGDELMSVTCTVDRHASFNKLFKLLIDKGIKKKELCEIAGVSPTSIAKLVHGGNVSTDMLCKICCALDCDIGDIMEFVKN